MLGLRSVNSNLRARLLRPVSYQRAKHTFVVHAPDVENGGLQKRLTVREKHLERARPLAAEGFIRAFPSLLIYLLQINSAFF